MTESDWLAFRPQAHFMKPDPRLDGKGAPTMTMTESEWLASGDPAAMLDWFSVRAQCKESWHATERKLRLFACACCRQVMQPGLPGGIEFLELDSKRPIITDVEQDTEKMLLHVLHHLQGGRW
jgi:hypothetical protein